MIKKSYLAIGLFALTAGVTFFTANSVNAVELANTKGDSNAVVATNTSSQYTTSVASANLEQSVESTAALTPELSSSNPNLYISLIIASVILLVGAAAQSREI